MPIIDFHNHLTPGVDDGAQDKPEAAAAIEAFAADGVTGVVVTPHFDANLTLNQVEFQKRIAEIDAGWDRLQEVAKAYPKLTFYRGAELLLDVPEPDLSDARIRLNGGRFFLMEFPFMMIPPQSARVVRGLTGQGYTPIIAHPERYHGMAAHLDQASEWKQAGALLQVNGGSLLGRYGAEPRRIAFQLLQRGWVDYLCSDYHARGNPLVAEYRRLLESHDAAEQAHTLMTTNPERMLAGQLPLPVTALRIKQSIWTRMTAIFK